MRYARYALASVTTEHLATELCYHQKLQEFVGEKRFCCSIVRKRRMIMLSSLSLRVCLFGALVIAVALGQSIEDEFNNPCTTVTDCGQCIQTSRLCAWCGAETFPRDYTRCDLLDNLKKNCDEKDISNPESTSKNAKDDDWTSGGQDKPPVQVKPQAMNFTIRPNDPMNFKLHFRQQANYPVDLYFLLDLSYGMFRQKEAQTRLIALGEDIPDSMKNITNNFRLGFGTFVDKLLMPYTAWTDKMLQDRCPLKSGECRKPHDFRNQVNLGEDDEAFANQMKSALEDVSQSLDDAEGGFDGLIQALDCDLIGWRGVSRRIIVYSSNSLFHLAGMGKLGGATKQSNLQCDLNADGEYAGEKIYDYPSVSQIADKLRQKNANVIFAVMSNVTKDYKLLENFLDGAVVGELADNSKNIVELIASKYYELRSQIQFRPSNADNVEITLKSKCKGNVVKETDKCENLEIMDAVEFDVSLTVSKDVCDGQHGGVVKKQVLLNAVGLNEQLVMNLDILCECQCEGSDAEELNSEKCSENGTYECGICDCNESRFGAKCQCDETQFSNEESLEMCRMKKNESTICSGNGECICGKCENCFPIPNDPKGNVYSGPFCQCNNFNCPLGENRQPCAKRGSCRCSKCQCSSGWTGPTCECSTNTDTCFASNGKLCNGVGYCECGTCICNATTDKFGPTCEDCASCPKRCSEYMDCAQCKAHKSGTYNIDDCEANCKNTVVKNDLPSGEGIEKCEGVDVDGCSFFFTYHYTPNNNVLVTSQITKECPEKANIEAIIGGTVAAVVIIPLFIICLIIFIRNRRDAKEYADFMREREKAHWDATSNPIYKDPKSTFQNPTYKGGKK